MRKTDALISKILITIIAARIFCPPLYHKTIILATIAIIAIVIMQRRMDAKYPYDMTAYIWYTSNDEPELAMNEIEGFAHGCPHYDPDRCLRDTVCPDCQYGHR